MALFFLYFAHGPLVNAVAHRNHSHLSYPHFKAFWVAYMFLSSSIYSSQQPCKISLADKRQLGQNFPVSFMSGHSNLDLPSHSLTDWQVNEFLKMEESRETMFKTRDSSS